MARSEHDVASGADHLDTTENSDEIYGITRAMILKHRGMITDTLQDTKYGILEKLLASGGLNHRETTAIAKFSTDPYERSSKLIVVILHKNILSQFIKALVDTDQEHLVNYLRGNGVHNTQFGDDWPLADDRIKQLDVNQGNLIDIIDPCNSGLIDKLFSARVINERQFRFISEEMNSISKNDALLSIIRRQSVKDYNSTILCFMMANQLHIADILQGPGVTQRIRVSQEGDPQIVNPIENALVDRFAELLRYRSIEDARRIFARTELKIVAAKTGESIYLYVYCATLKELVALHNILVTGAVRTTVETLFNQLVSREDRIVVSCTYSEEEYVKCKTYFEETGSTHSENSAASEDTGTAVQVIVANDDHSFTLDESALEEILLSSKVRDRNVIVLSIAGAFRKGKSFLLNFFLRYLNAQGKKSWIGDPNDSLKGFDSKAGTERCTSGILMWSNPLEVELSSGEKACVLLMDTQGAFDNQSTVKDCATVFALSTILSSVQVYNVTSNIQENDLQHLQFFAEYGRLALDGSTSKPFQDLYFLVRDFQCPYQYSYGWEGGEKYLAKCLEITNGQDQELQHLREDLRSCFAKLGCCLMPYPGKEVATNQHFDGRLSDIDDDFTHHVQEFVSNLLAPENLVVKEINGTKITGKELFKCFKEYSKIFQGNELPELGPMFKVTAKLNQQAAVSKAIDHYTTLMTQVCGDSKKYVDPETLKRDSKRYQEEAVEIFQSISKMGGDEMTHEHLEQLNQQLNESFNRYESDNSAFLDKAKLSHMDAVNTAMDTYRKNMKLVCGDSEKHVDPVTLKRDNERYQKRAVELFQSISKMGGDEMTHEYLEKLKRQLNELFNHYDSENSAILDRAKLSHAEAVKGAMKTYRQRIEMVYGKSKKYVDPETLKRDNERYQEQVVELFQLVDKKGGDKMTQDYFEQLKQQLNDAFNTYESLNSKKKVDTKPKTPVGLLVIFVVLFLTQTVLKICGFELMANICFGGMIVILIALFTWLYSLVMIFFARVAPFVGLGRAAVNVIQHDR